MDNRDALISRVETNSASAGVRSSGVTSLRWYGFAAFFALISALALLGSFIYNVIDHDLTESAISMRASIATLAANSVNQEIQSVVEIGRSLATRVRFNELASLGRWREAVAIMATVPGDFDDIEQVLVLSADGVLQASAPNDVALVGQSFADRAWYKTAMTTMKPFVSPTVHEDFFPNGDFFIALPMLMAEKQVYSLLVLRVSANRLAHYFSSIDFGYAGAIKVIDRAGLLAYDSSRPQAGRAIDVANDSIVARALKGESGVELDDDRLPDESDRVRYVSAFAPTRFGGAVIAQWPRDAVFMARDHELRRVVFWIAALGLAIAATVALGFQLAAHRKQRELDRDANIELETHVRQRTAQLEMANSELESFSYSVSHDLRAPLRAIDGYAKLLCDEQDAHLSDEARRYAGNIRRNIARMANLIEELLKLSQLGRAALNYQTIDTAAVVKEVLGEVLPNSNTAAVEVRELPLMRGDAAMFREVWRNLLDNAVKYSSHRPQPKIIVSAQQNVGVVVFCVADNGAGFDMQYYEQLFKPFSRLHGAGEFAGTGVGLATVKRIVERHHGTIWAKSAPDEGTQIYFSLPMHE